MTWIEDLLIVAARRARCALTTSWSPPTRAERDRQEAQASACQRFLEAHAPEYAQVRAWRSAMLS